MCDAVQESDALSSSLSVSSTDLLEQLKQANLPAPHLRRDSAHICAGTRPTSAPGLGPHLHRDSAHICAGTRPTSAPGRVARLIDTDSASLRAVVGFDERRPHVHSAL